MPTSALGSPRAQRVLTAITFGVALALSQSAIALGYSHSGAASWADSHINGCGLYHEAVCYDNDCTGFVSEALHFGGGYPYVGVLGGRNTGDVHRWYSGWGLTRVGYDYYWARPTPLRTTFRSSFSMTVRVASPERRN